MSPTHPNDFHTRAGFGLCTIARADRISQEANQGTIMTIKNYLLIAASAITMSACGGGDAPSQQEDCFPLVEYQKLISGGYFTPVPASWPSHWHWDGVWLTDPQGQFLPWGGAIAAHYGPYYEPGKPPAFVCKE